MAMRHSKAIYLLEGFDARELSPRQKVSLDTHLAACSACASRAARTPSLQDLLAAAMQAEIPGFDQALETVRHSTLRAARQEASRSLPLFAWARLGGWGPVTVPAAALAGAFLVGLVLLLPKTGESHTVPAEPILQAQAVPAAPPAVEPAAAPAESPRKVAGHPREARETRQSGALTASFDVVRSGSEVRIEWSRMQPLHHVSKAQDPQQVQVAGRHLVHGSTWSDAADGQAPGSVTYYLVD